MMECFKIAPAVVALLKADASLSAMQARIHPFEPSLGFVNAAITVPHIFVYLSSSEFDKGIGSEYAEQQHSPTMYCDVYGFGNAKLGGPVNDFLVSEHAATRQAETALSHAYNVIMDRRRKYDDFGMTQDTGGRYASRIEAFTPAAIEDSKIGAKIIRFAFQVHVLETPTGEPDGVDLDPSTFDLSTEP